MLRSLRRAAVPVAWLGLRELDLIRGEAACLRFLLMIGGGATGGGGSSGVGGGAGNLGALILGARHIATVVLLSFDDLE